MKPQLPVRQAILDRRTYEAPAAGRWNKVRLDFNENTAGCSKAVTRALGKLTPKHLAMYPEYQPFIERLARYFGVRTQEMLLANGGDDALRVFFDAFVEVGSHVLICEPTFPMYRYYAEIAGARIDVLRYGREMEFPLDAAISALQKKPRVFFIANPNNPTGTLVPKESIRKLLQAATHTAVVIDEAYADFSRMTVLPLRHEFPQLFVARTFSKAAGLASLRLGAVLAAQDSLSYLRRAMPPYPLNLAALVAADAAVRERRTMQRYIREVLRLRTWLEKQLQLLGIKTYLSAGNFLLADFGPKGPALFQKLERQGILVRERSKDIAPGFVRITIGTEPEMQKLIKMIRKEWKTPS